MVWTSEASRPSEDIWERQRPHIEELYLELPLKTVMTVMKATCDFDASYDPIPATAVGYF